MHALMLLLICTCCHNWNEIYVQLIQKVILGDQREGTSKKGPKMGYVIYECSLMLCHVTTLVKHLSPAWLGSAWLGLELS